MYVKQLIRMIHDYEYVCVEDNDYNVYAEGEACQIIHDKNLRGLKVACCHSGNRSGNPCIVIIAER